jgi:catechol 2,3-dioxygenase-like lactoylglutathione lyase family enzyme
MQLYGVRVFVDDYEAARRFYAETLGLEVSWEMAEDGVAGFDIGGAVLIVEAVRTHHEYADLVGRFLGVSLQVEDIEATWRALDAKGVEFEAPPEKQLWGGTLAHFKDPAGNVLTLLG